jgi:hypothetical protein
MLSLHAFFDGEYYADFRRYRCCVADELAIDLVSTFNLAGILLWSLLESIMEWELKLICSTGSLFL